MSTPYTPSKQSLISATLVMRLNNQEIINTMHYQPEEPESGTFPDGEAVLDEFASIIDEADNGWSFKQAVFSSVELTIVALRLQFIYPTRYAYKTYTTTAEAGTQVGDALPQNVSAALTMQTNFAGRHEHGTLKIGGLPSSAVVNGYIDNITRGHIASMGQWLTQVSPGATFAHPYKAIVLRRVEPTLSNVITHNVVGTTARVMRRRTVGLGI